jgi:RNA 3'-terminal phosphate cyclase (ATP)
VTEVFSCVGSFNVSAEAVAETLARAVLSYRAAGAPVGEHLADQLMLPLALGAGGHFVTSDLTQHSLTNIEVMARFLDGAVTYMQLGRKLWRIEISAGR